MDGVEGARTFGAAGAAYDSFMGRYSTRLARWFTDAAGIAPARPQSTSDAVPGH